MPTSRIAPYAFILIAGIIWGSTFSLALIATGDGAHPLTLTTWQVILTAFIFVVICKISKVTIFNFKHLHYYSILAMLGIIAPDLLYYNAAPHLSAGILSVTVSTVPMFTYAMMWIMKFEPLIIKRAFGIILGMAAILLLVIPDQGLSSADANLWTLVVVLCALCYAIENVYIGEGLDPKIDIWELLCGSNIVAAIILIPVSYLMGHSVPIGWIFSDAAWAIFAIAVGSSIAYTLFFHTIKSSGPVFASQCAYVVTISGVLWGILIFSERHTIWVWLSVGVMMIGLALVTPREKPLPIIK